MRADVDNSGVRGQIGDEVLCDGLETKVVGFDDLLHFLGVEREGLARLVH